MCIHSVYMCMHIVAIATLDANRFWFRCTQIKTYSWDNAQVVLVGNKCDMEDERVVSYDRGRQLADQLGLEFFETSAKENINVKAVFERLVDIICDKMAESIENDPNATQVRVLPDFLRRGGKGRGGGLW